MPFLPSVDVDDKVPHVLAKFNTGTGRPLIEFHEALLRGDSPFVEGIGLTPIPDHFDMEGRLIKEGSYKGMLDAFGIVWGGMSPTDVTVGCHTPGSGDD